MGAVGRAIGLDRGGDLLAQCDAFALGRTVGNALERRRVRLFDDGLLIGIELEQDLRAAAAAAASADAAGAGNGSHVARVPTLHRVDRVGHRDVHHRQGARPGLPPTPATFITSSAVWFQSVTVSARAVQAANAMSSPTAMAQERFMMPSDSVSDGLRTLG